VPTPLPLSWWLRFVALSLIWGMSFLLIAIAGHSYTPAQIAFGRTACAAAVLNVTLLWRRQRLPRSAQIWLQVAVGAVLVSSVPFTLFAYAEQRISSTLAGIINATTPLFTAVVVTLLNRRDRPGPVPLAGIAIGFLGIVVVLGLPGTGGGGGLAGVFAALAAAACYGLGWPYLGRTLGPQRAGAPQGLALPTVILTAAAAQTGVVALFSSSSGPLVPATDPGPVLALAALGILGTGVAYILQLRLLTQAGATMTSLVTYVIPLVSTAAGVVLLGEPLHINQAVGAVVVLVGAYLAQRAAPNPRPGAGRRPHVTEAAAPSTGRRSRCGTRNPVA